MADDLNDPLASVLDGSRDDLIQALGKAENRLALYRDAAAALERRIQLVRELLGITEPLPAGASNPATGPERPEAAKRPLKYDALAVWLRQQPRRPMEVTFKRVEEILGRSLPPSSRRYAAHWHGWDGSAVARAIQRAGWGVRKLNMAEESLVFVPQPEYRRAHE